MVSISEALKTGTRHHHAGQLAEAERVYRQILAVEPENPQALYLLGLLAMQASQFEAAAELLARAIRGDAAQPAFHAKRGEVQQQLGQTAAAIESYRRALQLDPQVPAVRIAWELRCMRWGATTTR